MLDEAVPTTGQSRSPRKGPSGQRWRSGRDAGGAKFAEPGLQVLLCGDQLPVNCAFRSRR